MINDSGKLLWPVGRTRSCRGHQPWGWWCRGDWACREDQDSRVLLIVSQPRRILQGPLPLWSSWVAKVCLLLHSGWFHLFPPLFPWKSLRKKGLMSGDVWCLGAQSQGSSILEKKEERGKRWERQWARDLGEGQDSSGWQSEDGNLRDLQKSWEGTGRGHTTDLRGVPGSIRTKPKGPVLVACSWEISESRTVGFPRPHLIYLWTPEAA